MNPQTQKTAKKIAANTGVSVNGETGRESAAYINAVKTTAKTYTSPHDKMVFSYKGRLHALSSLNCECAADAAQLPDVLEVRYTFRLPEACQALVDLLSTDWYIFSTDEFVAQRSGVSLSITGFGRYVLRCPFIPCALCLEIDADAFAWTAPAVLVKDGLGFTPSNSGAVGATSTDLILGNVLGNAVIEHGIPALRFKQLLVDAFGIRVEFGCDNIVQKMSLSELGVNANQTSCPGVSYTASPLLDLQDLNAQLRGDTLETGYQAQIDNVEPSCGDNVESIAQPAVIQQSPCNCSVLGMFEGCMVLPRIPMLAGSGFDVIVYTLPNHQDLRDQLLQQGCIQEVNPANLGDTIVDSHLDVQWINAAAINFFVDDDIVSIPTNGMIPQALLQVEEINVATPNATIIKARYPFNIGAVPSLAGASNPGTALATVDRTVALLSTPLGSAKITRIGHGLLVMTFSVRGCYIKAKDMAKYFQNNLLKVGNERVINLIIESKPIKDAIESEISKDPKAFGFTGKGAYNPSVGLAGVPDVAKLLSSGKEDGSDDELPARCLRGRLLFTAS